MKSGKSKKMCTICKTAKFSCQQVLCYSFGAISHKIALVAVQSTVKELLRD